MKITAKKYAQLIYESTRNLGDKDIVEVLKKITAIIRENGDSGKMGRIIDEFERIYKQQKGVVEVRAVTATRLSDAELDHIKKKVAKKFGVSEDKIIVANDQDGKLGGGIIIHVGDEVWDGSVKNKMEKLRAVLAH